MGKGMIALTIFGILIAIVALLWYHGATQSTQYHEDMIKADCFPLDVEWDEEKGDYNKWPPSGWDCSRDKLGNLKSEFQHLPK